MKNSIKYTAVAALLSLASVNAWADQTNLVRNFDIQLSGFQQGDTTTTKNVTTTEVNKVKFDGNDIVAAIGTATGNSFSSNARLVVITAVPSGASHIEIRDGATKFDATPFFAQTYVTDAVGKSTVNSKNGKSSGSNYSIQQFWLVDGNGYSLSFHFSLSGIAVENFSIPAIPGPRSELKADISGQGDLDGQLLILQGSLKVTGQTVEVVAGGSGPPA